jgi:hypothetical protein
MTASRPTCIQPLRCRTSFCQITGTIVRLMTVQSSFNRKG